MTFLGFDAVNFMVSVAVIYAFIVFLILGFVVMSKELDEVENEKQKNQKLSKK